MMGAKINRANTPMHAVIRDVQESPGLRCCCAIELIVFYKSLKTRIYFLFQVTSYDASPLRPTLAGANYTL